MVRFDREEVFEADAKGYPLEAFLVDNSQLKSDARGIAYRHSMNLKDKDRKIAEFGSVVRGKLTYSQDRTKWLQVQDLYLPLQVGDKEILLPAWWDRSETLADPVENHMSRARAAAAPVARQEPADEVEEQSFHSPPEVRPLIPGTGCLYEVVSDRLIIRTAPHPAAPMQGTRRKGQVLELFDWDEHRQWRRIRTKLNNAWVALDWDEQPLLRPQGVQFSQRPLDPLCQAAREGCPQDVLRFISDGLNVHVPDADGQTPLMLAAQKEGWRGLVCSVLLLEANADPNLSLHKGEPLAEEFARLEAEKRQAVESEDFHRAQELKEQLATLNQQKQAETAASLAGDTAAAQLLKSLQGVGTDSSQLLTAFDDIAALPETLETKSIPRRVQALQAAKRPGAAQGSARHTRASHASVPAVSAAKDHHRDAENETGEPWLDSPHQFEPKFLQGVLFRVLQTAPVFEEPNMSADKLGNVRQHQLLEVLGYNTTRSFGRVEVITPEKKLEKGWVLLEDEFLGDLMKALPRR